MSSIKTGDALPSMVPNAASYDSFYAPDSTSKRPDPTSMADRPRKPDQFTPTASEAVLNKEQK